MENQEEKNLSEEVSTASKDMSEKESDYKKLYEMSQGELKKLSKKLVKFEYKDNIKAAMKIANFKDEVVNAFYKDVISKDNEIYKQENTPKKLAEYLKKYSTDSDYSFYFKTVEKKQTSEQFANNFVDFAKNNGVNFNANVYSKPKLSVKELNKKFGN